MMQNIRLAYPQDLPAVEAIVRAAYSRYIPLVGQKPGPMLDDYSALIAERRVHVLVAENEVAGILVLLPDDGAMLLDNVAVHPDRHGRGYGRALIAFAERVARERGFKAIRLYTNEAMTENVGLYERLGFVETHRGEEKGFRREDFARIHPGGALGRQLLTRVDDVMVIDGIPTLSSDATMREAIVLIAERRGIAIVVEDEKLVGVLTAGDLTRLMERVEEGVFRVPVRDVMTTSPRVATLGELGSSVVYRMERHGIMSMPVLDEHRHVRGVIHLHDLMRAGIS